MQDFFDELQVAEMYYHIMWSTKNQNPCIPEPCASQLLSWMGDLALSIECHVIDGKIASDHIQLVVKGCINVSLETLMITLKSGSLLLVKNYFPEIGSFDWQKSDFAFSVSSEDVEFVFIKDTLSFSEMMLSFLDQNDISFDLKEILE